jgi:ABC-type phosphate transport system substrate-binding protein
MRAGIGRRRLVAGIALFVAISLVSLSGSPAMATSTAGNHALVQASGSSWAANAISQWVADVKSSGMQVVFTASGSAQGRKDFSHATNDFAQSEIGFQGVDPLTGENDSAGTRAYAYLPLVSGGTAFPYQIRVRGELVRDLRLSGRTLTKIFTNQIDYWDHADITADNNGRVLPHIPVVPVVHAEGSGASHHLSDYFDKQFPDLWRSFSGHPGATEYYPRKGRTIAQTGSDGVMNFVASAAGNGSIGYDEYSYPKGKNWPSAKIGNAAGYYTLPTQYNVAVALTQAIINQDKNSKDYLLQNLDRLYTFNDPRTYPLSSYSYTIIPTGANDPKFSGATGTAKRQTVADFLYYSLCEGQKEVGNIGYSSLPVNLVQASFDQVGKLKAADPMVDLTRRDVSTCQNPTFIPGQPNRNYLAEVAPMPPACDKNGQGPCADGKSVAIGIVEAETAAGAGAEAAAAEAAAAAAAAAKAGGKTDASKAAAAKAASEAAAEAAAAEAAAEEAAAAAGGGATRASSNSVTGELPAGLVPLALLLVGAIVIAPPFLFRRFRRSAVVSQ